MEAKPGAIGLFLLTFLITFSSTFGNVERLETTIDAFIEKILSCRDIVGMNLAVVQEDEVLLTRGYGVKNLNTMEPVTNRTMFCVASLSKAVATTLLAKQLSENEKYNWNTPVREILGENFYFADAHRTLTATLRDIAAHKMGILSHNYARLQDRADRATLVSKLRFLKAYYPFRTRYVYNNLMYGLLAHISEKLDGKTSWETLITENIFRPLNMSDSTFTNIADLRRPDIALPYLFDNASYRLVPLEMNKIYGQLGASGSILTHADDMAKYLLFQLSKGKNQEGVQIVSQRVLEETHKGDFSTPTTSTFELYKRPVIPVTYAQEKYALGWRTGYYRGLPILTHTGSSWGYGALLTLIPSMKLGIYTGITGPDAGYVGRRLIHLYIMDLLLGEHPWLNLTTACSFPEPWKGTRRPKPDSQPEIGKSALPLPAYTGTYGNFAYGNLTVYLNQSTKLLRITYGPIGKWDLYPTKKDHTFNGHGDDLVWCFRMEAVFIYNADKDSIDSVKIPPWQTNQEVEFQRNLKMSDAPAPPDLVNCEDPPSSKGPNDGRMNNFVCINVLLLIIAVCQYFFQV